VGLDSNGKLLKADGFTIQVIDEDILSTPEQKGPVDFKIYPNPSSDLVAIEVNSTKTSDAEIYVLNSVGQLVLHKNIGLSAGDNATILSLGNLKSGLYFVQFSTEQGSVTKRIMLNK
jgi:hypothetical protein